MFRVFIVLCNHHLCLVAEHSPAPQKETFPLAVTPHPLLLRPWQPPVCFLSLWICLFWTFHVLIDGIIWHVAFDWHMASFTQPHVFKLHLWCVRTSSLVWPNSNSLVCMDHSLFICSSPDGHLGCCPLVTVDSAAVNTHVQGFAWTHVFGSLSVPRSEIAESYGNCMFNLWETARLFSTVGGPFSILTSSILGFQFSTSSPMLKISFFLKKR